MSRILVTPRSLTGSPGDLLAPLEAAGHEIVLSPPGRQPSEQELIALVPGCEGWLAGVEPIGARVFAAAERLQVISRNGTGIDSVDLDAARRNGVRVLVAAGANATSVAELALAFILAGMRHLPRLAGALKAGRWESLEGREIAGASVGIVGCGAVGRRLATMAAALGAEVIAFDPVPARDFAPPAGRFAWASLDAVLERADVVSLHCPARPDGAPLLDGAALARLKRGAGIVNTARASLVDEAALLQALGTGQVGWYATDVFAVEPPPPSPLLAHPDVIATPHIGGRTAEGGRTAIRVAVENLIEALAAPAPVTVGARTA